MFRQLLLLMASLGLAYQSAHGYMTAYLHNGETVTSNGSRTIEVDISSNWNFPDLIVDQDRWGVNCGNAAQISISGSACSIQNTWTDGWGCGERYVKVSGVFIPANAIGTCRIQYYADGDNAGTQTYVETFSVKVHENWIGAPANSLVGDTYSVEYSIRNRSGVDAFDINYISRTPNICRIESNGSVRNLWKGTCILDINAVSKNAAYASKTVTEQWDILPDADLDGITDADDNCPTVANKNQENFDKALEDAAGKANIGDACNDQFDKDEDEIQDDYDLCPLLALMDDNAAADGATNHPDVQAPFNVGDSCETNSDNDSWLDYEDNCPFVDNDDQLDTNGPNIDDGLPDGVGDACGSANEDGDNWYDHADNCPKIANNDQLDTDKDGVGEACEKDSDGDGVKDSIIGERDNCPSIQNPDQLDANNNLVGDVCEMTFVKPQSEGGNDTKDCLTWDKACATIQEGLNKAETAQVSQVFVQQGDYEQATTLQLKAGLRVIGGFEGYEVNATDARPVAFKTTIRASDSLSAPLIQAKNLAGDTTARLQGVTITGSKLNALVVENSKVSLVNTTFVGNSSDVGGAVMDLKLGANVELTNADISNNTASAGSAGINVADSQFRIANSTFEDNQGKAGAVINASGASVVSIDLSEIKNNNADGNGVLLTNGTQVELKLLNSTIEANSAKSGGALYINDAKSLSVGNVLFKNNIATDGAAGVIMLAGGSNAVDATITQSSFIGNKASKNGGAIAPGVGRSLLIENVTFANNKAGVDADGNANGFSSRGGAINVGGAATNITIRYSTFVGNAAEGSAKGGGAIAINNNLPGSVSMMANLLAGNTGANGANIFVDNVGGSKTITDMGYNYVGFNNVSGLSPANALNLAASSTVMQAADLTSIVATTPTNSGGDGYGSPLPMLPLKEDSEARNVIDDGNCATTVDQRGEARPDAAKCDIGAYEYTELSCIDDAQRRQAAGEGLVKYCAPGFEEIEFTIGQVHYYVLILLSLLGLGLAVRRK